MDRQALETALSSFAKISSRGGREMSLVGRLVLYFTGEIAPHWPGILSVHDGVLEWFGDRLTRFAVDGQGPFRPIESDTYQLIQAWSDGSTKPRGTYGLLMRDGSEQDAVGEHALDFYWDGVDAGFVVVSFPAQQLLEAKTADRLLELAAPLGWLHGAAGFGMAYREGLATSAPTSAVHGLSRRFLGVDFTEPLYFAAPACVGLTTVNWLTFVSDELVDKASENLAATLQRDFTTHRLPGGWVVCASPAADLCDSNRPGEVVQQYRNVDRALASVRVAARALGGFDGIGGEENTAWWLQRFGTDGELE